MSDPRGPVTPEDELMRGDVAAVKFPNPGDKVTGVIIAPFEMRQQRDFKSGKPLVWDDGSPRKQIVITMHTDQIDPKDPDDDGVRALHVRIPSDLRNQIRLAVKKANVPLPEVGGTLAITYVKDGEQANPKISPPKLFAVTYRPPTSTPAEDEPPF